MTTWARRGTGWALALALLFTAGCDDDGGGDDAGPSDADDASVADAGPGASCSAGELSPDIVNTCRAQNPSPPSPGRVGAACAGDGECDSGSCLEPAGEPAYCTEACAGDTCPVGFACEDTGRPLGTVCRRVACAYGGEDASACITNLNAEVDEACGSGCAAALEAWMSCVAGASRFCAVADADAACGAEREALEGCCPSCDASRW